VKNGPEKMTKEKEYEDKLKNAEKKKRKRDVVKGNERK
jgi:hypothetical protein